MLKSVFTENLKADYLFLKEDRQARKLLYAAFCLSNQRIHHHQYNIQVLDPIWSLIHPVTNLIIYIRKISSYIILPSTTLVT